jgi:membrane-associated phospholipid phosphatase
MNWNKHLWMSILLMISLSAAWSQDSALYAKSFTTLSDLSLFRASVSPSLLYKSASDTIPPPIDWNYTASVNKPFPFKSMIIPGVMIAYGFTALNSHGLKNLNSNVKDEIWTDNPHRRTTIDSYLQFAPAFSVYALNLAGIHGKHNFKDRTMIYLMANLFAEGTVFSLKGITHQLRPDGSAYNSFPSGHTAEAFASAEFMRMEYKDVSPWYGVAGYAMATTTGILRLYNNKHWLSDVVTGAGIGIASTRLAYWLYPVVQHAFGKNKAVNSVIMPTYQNGSFGLAYAHRF